ncbi:serine hydrolase domain-containing protein [Nannocystis sp.]|uniref:serine hydrolase domain-containing protein n=1 Tax=Nannocystis sp. TaxID=1962667 RepID=UPI0025E504B0|nr:serine hydrolase domain-containing protein [Nannocystis sp.]MBK7828875.1 beta-lactamase family protein [Nannocystis sp.]
MTGAGWWLLVMLVAPGSDAGEARRAACMRRNEGAPVRYRGLVRALCADHRNLGGVGASVAVGEGGALRFVATAGERCAGGPPVTAETGFRVGSLTKLVTAALALTEVDAGRMELDAAIVTLLPELAAWDDRRAAAITLRELLTHSAGLADLHPWSAPGDEWIDVLGERPLWTSPGTLWSYSNAGYALVGAAIERSAGDDYAALAWARVLAPLGLRHATLDVTRALRGDVACGHLGRGAGVFTMDLAEDLEIGAGGASWTRPAGGMIASAGELVTLALGLGDPLVSPLSAGAIAALLRPELATHERPGEFSALGLRARRLGDGSWLYIHSGNTGDFAAELVLVPARGFALALLGNTGDPLQATALVGVQELLGERVPLPLPAGPTSDYAGVYVAGDDAIAVELVGGSLTIAGRGLQGRLTHAGDHRFRAEGLRETLTFVFMGPGPASYVRGPAFVASRVQAPRRK